MADAVGEWPGPGWCDVGQWIQRALDNPTVLHAGWNRCASPVRRHKTEVQFECIGQRCDAFCASSVFAHNDSLSPASDVAPDPSGYERFGVEVFNGFAEEAASRRCLVKSAVYVCTRIGLHEGPQ